MLKSQPAICSAVAGAPRFGRASSGAMSSSAGAFEGSIAKPAATATAAEASRARARASHVEAMAATPSSLCVDIAHLAVRGHGPALNRVVMIPIARAALREQRGTRRLYRAGLVDRTALQHRGAAVPTPCDSETAQRLRQHRLVERRLGPRAAAVGRDLDAPDPPGAGPRETRDTVHARPAHRPRSGRRRDHRPHAQPKRALARLAGRD